MAISRPNQVWSADITYIRLARGFAHLVAVIDGYSRRVLSWRISNSMETVFCVDCLQDALLVYGKLEVFNTDQDSQFTSDAFTGALNREGVIINMDGRSRAFDLHFCQAALAQRQARGHAPQGLGGAMIMAKYGATQSRSMALRSTGTQFDEVRLEKPEIRNAKKSGQRRPAVCLIGCNLN